MSLNFELKDIENHETLCFMEAESDAPDGSYQKGERIMNPKTRAIIWLTLGCGIGVIDDKSWQDFYARAALLEKVDGCFVRKLGGDNKWIDQPLTPEDIYAHRGLRTNVTKETDAKWAKRIFVDNKMRNYRYGASQWLKQSSTSATDTASEKVV